MPRVLFTTLPAMQPQGLRYHYETDKGEVQYVNFGNHASSNDMLAGMRFPIVVYGPLFKDEFGDKYQVHDMEPNRVRDAVGVQGSLRALDRPATASRLCHPSAGWPGHSLLQGCRWTMSG